MLRDMHAGVSVGGAWAPRDEAYAGPARRLAIGVGHHRGAALVAADGDVDVAFVAGVERREIALARNAEYMIDAVHDQLIDQNLRRRLVEESLVHVRARPCSQGPKRTLSE